MLVTLIDAHTPRAASLVRTATDVFDFDALWFRWLAALVDIYRVASAGDRLR